MKPTTINQLSDLVISLTWDDGHESIYFAGHLRRNCPCAVCEKIRAAGNNRPFKILQSAPDTVKFTDWKQVGRYALAFTFSDGHTTGIYQYENLRALCQCDQCDPNTIRIQGPFRG